MDDRTALGTPNLRRANRVPLVRPVRIVTPSFAEGQTVNISACGLLVRLKNEVHLWHGDAVSLEIPRSDGKATLRRQGRVVRIEHQPDATQVAIDLL